MTDELKATYEHWKEAAQKLDYFLVGLSAAIVSFEVRDFHPDVIGMNPGTVELTGITLILASMAFGLRRLRAFVSYLSRNHSRLILELDVERREAALAAYDRVEVVSDLKTGAPISREYIMEEVQRGRSLIDKERGEWSANARRLQRYHDGMSWCLVLGLLLIIGARVWKAEFLQAKADAVRCETPCTTHAPHTT